MPAQTLLSFRAGKLARETESSDTIVPDLRKGYIQLVSEEELLHFQWKERSASAPEDDLIIFPEDARFVRVSEATDGRVYMLRFESSKAKHFFWMQVPIPQRWLLTQGSIRRERYLAGATVKHPH
jgi:26S proteasome regulatory subunit N13